MLELLLCNAKEYLSIIKNYLQINNVEVVHGSLIYMFNH